MALFSLFAFPSSSAFGSELWRCSGNVFTSRPEQASVSSGECVPFRGSRVCGTGLNRYYTPERAGLRAEDPECLPASPEASPLVNRAYQNGEGLGPLRAERKLQSTLAKSASKEQLEQDLEKELSDIAEILPQLPGGKAVLKMLEDRSS